MSSAPRSESRGRAGRQGHSPAPGYLPADTWDRSSAAAWPRRSGSLATSGRVRHRRAATRELAPRISCRLAFHLSGARPADLLAPFREQGASVGSLHALRAFHGDSSESWKDAFVAVEGDRPAVDAGIRIAAAVGARAREVSANSKPLYHAAATLAAGGLLSLVS